MLPQIRQASIILREWNGENHEETVVSFTSLEELYAFCLTLKHPGDVDYVVIQGLDERGRRRQLTLAYQSITDC